MKAQNPIDIKSGSRKSLVLIPIPKNRVNKTPIMKEKIRIKNDVNASNKV